MIANRLSQAAMIVLLAQPAQAGSSKLSAPEAEIAVCIRRAASGHTWLEKTLWGLRDQEAGWVGAQILNSNGTHDLGPLQVNSWWVARIARRTGREPSDVRFWLTHDACFNVVVARWIFLSALTSTRDYWKAIGVYHSPTGWRQRRYATSVAGKLTRRFGADIFGSSSPSHDPRDFRGARRP
jgi:hypothetical protein